MIILVERDWLSHLERTKVMTKISKPTSNGATVTPTVDPKSVARCGIPAPSAKGRNNVKLRLAENAAELLASNPMPAQAQAILFELDKLGGAATTRELLDALSSKESSLSTTQTPERILTFYRKKLIDADMLIAN
tara:strand:+ start:3276 stop:3680 length:405 start_codon:yes stop_codon:yes gene_type:complete